jgi:hypothetical protein
MVQFECGTRILRVIHGRDARATSPNCTTTRETGRLPLPLGEEIKRRGPGALKNSDLIPLPRGKERSKVPSGVAPRKMLCPGTPLVVNFDLV